MVHEIFPCVPCRAIHWILRIPGWMDGTVGRKERKTKEGRNSRWGHRLGGGIAERFMEAFMKVFYERATFRTRPGEHVSLVRSAPPSSSCVYTYIYTHLHSLVPVLRYSDTVQLMLLWKNRKRCRSMHACARLSPRFSLPGRFDTLVFFLPFFLFAPVDQLVSQRGGEGRGLEQERDKSFLSFSSVELSVSIFIFEKNEREKRS